VILLWRSPKEAGVQHWQFQMPSLIDSRARSLGAPVHRRETADRFEPMQSQSGDIECTGDRSYTFSSDISVWKNPSSARCQLKVSPQVTTRMSTRSSRQAFSDTPRCKLNLAITAWTSFCALSASGQIRVTGAEGKDRTPFTAFHCNLVANLESPGTIEFVSIARPHCG